MRNHLLFVFVMLVFTPCLSADQAVSSTGAPGSSILAGHGRHPVIVAAVRARNANALSLEQITADDRIWQDTPGQNEQMTRILTSPCSNHLRTLQVASPYFSEIFVMDRRGAIVAMTARTSDYWQGDENKFIRAYNKGTGDVFVDQAEFDESSKVYQIQISVPVMDGTTAIGAMTFGIDVDRVD